MWQWCLGDVVGVCMARARVCMSVYVCVRLVVLGVCVFLFWSRFPQFLDSIVVSIPACHAGDPGSIPGRGAF